MTSVRSAIFAGVFLAAGALHASNNRFNGTVFLFPISLRASIAGITR